MSNHLVPLPGGPYRLWRWIDFRSAGFPASTAERLRCVDAAAFADALADAEAELARVVGEAVARVEAVRAAAAADHKKAIGRVVRRLRDGLPVEQVGDAAVDEAASAVAGARAVVAAARATYLDRFGADLSRAAAQARAVAGTSAFREALCWQNPDFLRRYEAGARQDDGTRNQRRRRDERTLATYAYRYAMKNDTIGFFGPAGWAELDERLAGARVEPGPGLLRRRDAYFDHWAAAALGRALCADRRVKVDAPPRLFAYVRLDGDAAALPFGARLDLSSDDARVAALCDGHRTGREIARLARADEATGFADDEGVFAALDRLEEAGVVLWTLESPACFRPLDVLARAVDRVVDDEARAAARAVLARLEDARRACVQAAGDPDALAVALRAVDAAFAEITGEAAARGAGEIYACRRVVYEDAVRDADVRLGRAFLDAIGPPLTLVLRSARWLAADVARRYRPALRALFDELARDAGSDEVEFLAFQANAMGRGLFTVDSPTPPELIAQAMQDYYRRWHQVLAPAADARRLDYDVDRIADAVAAAFPTDGAAWRSARHLSPDLLVAARDADALARGDFTAVLGELHAINTMSVWCSHMLHDDPEELTRAMDVDFDAPLVHLTQPTGTASRVTFSLFGSRDLHIVHDAQPAPYGVPPERVLRCADLVFKVVDDQLVLATRDGRVRADPLDAAALLLGVTLSSAARVAVLPAARHSPRVTFGKLVVGREAWRRAGDELTFADADDEAERFAAARRWRSEHGIPERVFVKTPTESKPVYVDFAAPASVEILAKLARDLRTRVGGDATMTFGELLPSTDELWLVDHAGARYTCELRLVAVVD